MISPAAASQPYLTYKRRRFLARILLNGTPMSSKHRLIRISLRRFIYFMTLSADIGGLIASSWKRRAITCGGTKAATGRAALLSINGHRRPLLLLPWATSISTAEISSWATNDDDYWYAAWHDKPARFLIVSFRKSQWNGIAKRACMVGRPTIPFLLIIGSVASIWL